MKTKIIKFNNGSEFTFEVERSELSAECREGGKVRAFNIATNIRTYGYGDKWTIKHVIIAMKSCSEKYDKVQLELHMRIKWLVNPKDFDTIVRSLNDFCPKEFTIS